MEIDVGEEIADAWGAGYEGPEAGLEDGGGEVREVGAGWVKIDPGTWVDVEKWLDGLQIHG